MEMQTGNRKLFLKQLFSFFHFLFIFSLESRLARRLSLVNGSFYLTLFITKSLNIAARDESSVNPAIKRYLSSVNLEISLDTSTPRAKSRL